MPNWNSNTVTIKSDDKELMAKVIAAAESSSEDDFFSKLVPMPESESDWYGWNVTNWGTKWDTGVNIVDQTDTEIVLSFDTAWSPPIAFYMELEQMGYEVEAYYYEPGMCFAGVYSDGNDNYYDYGGLSSDDVKEMLPEELDEMFCISESIAEWEEENKEEEEEDE
jgi:hypothetical protein